jgi:hypothetical protein
MNIPGKNRKENGSILPIVAGVAVVALIGVTSAYAYYNIVSKPQSNKPTATKSSSTVPAGNNGTLKTHEQGTASNTESTDPKLCMFNFEGFGFDKNQSGLIKIEPQGGDTTTTDTAELPFGPTDDKGYAQTPYIRGDADISLRNGHYKSTLYGKDAKGNYTIDLKAKSKVFKVDCPAEG